MDPQTMWSRNDVISRVVGKLIGSRRERCKLPEVSPSDVNPNKKTDLGGLFSVVIQP